MTIRFYRGCHGIIAGGDREAPVQARRHPFVFSRRAARISPGGRSLLLPMREECAATRERLGMSGEQFVLTFQSRFGKDEWLQPYTDKTVEALAKSGVKSLAIVTPGFVTVWKRSKKSGWKTAIFFSSTAARILRQFQCLNDTGAGVKVIRTVVARKLSGWLRPNRENRAILAGAAGPRRHFKASEIARGGASWTASAFSSRATGIGGLHRFCARRPCPRAITSRSSASGIHHHADLGLELHRALHRPHRREGEHDGAGDRHSNAGRHHQGQRDRRGGWRRLLPGVRCRPRELRNHQPQSRDPEPDHDQYPYGDGSMDLDMLLSHRDEINDRLLRWSMPHPRYGASRSRASKSRTSCRRPIWSRRWLYIKAERDKRAVVLEAEGQRQSEFSRRRRQAGPVLRGRRPQGKAAFREAEARERLAEADVKRPPCSARRSRGGQAGTATITSPKIREGDGSSSRCRRTRRRSYAAMSDRDPRLARRHCRTFKSVFGDDRPGAGIRRPARAAPAITISRDEYLHAARSLELVLSRRHSAVLEVMTPGIFMLWVGCHPHWRHRLHPAARLAGAGRRVRDHVGNFRCCSAGNSSRAGRSIPTSRFSLNRRHDALIGRVFTLDEPIVQGAGRVRVDDSTWRVTGPDRPAGTKAKWSAPTARACSSAACARIVQATPCNRSCRCTRPRGFLFSTTNSAVMLRRSASPALPARADRASLTSDSSSSRPRPSRSGDRACM